jgi:hypothetical protein
LFLELTGYPQLGNSELHIAHVLLGGLFLFIASILPLLIANRWVFSVTAVLAGLGWVCLLMKWASSSPNQ